MNEQEIYARLYAGMQTAEAVLGDSEKELSGYFSYLEEMEAEITTKYRACGTTTQVSAGVPPFVSLSDDKKLFQDLYAACVNAYGKITGSGSPGSGVTDACNRARNKLVYAIADRLQTHRNAISAKMREVCRERLSPALEQLENECASMLGHAAGMSDMPSVCAEKIQYPDDFPEQLFIPLGVLPEYSVPAKDDIPGRYRYLYRRLTGGGDGRLFGLPISASSGHDNLLLFTPRYADNEMIDDADLLTILKTLIYGYLTRLPRSAKRICFIQNRRLSGMQGFLSNLYSDGCKGLIETYGENSVISHNPRHVLESLAEDIETAETLLQAIGENALFNYNRENFRKGIWQQQTLLIIKDFPDGFSADQMHSLGDVLQLANNVGINVVMTVCRDLLERAVESEPVRKEWERILPYFGQQASLNEGKLAESASGSAIGFDAHAFDRDRFRFESFKTGLLRHMQNTDTDPSIPLTSVCPLPSRYDPEDECRNRFSRVLSLPVGRHGTEVFTLDLHSDSDAAHVVIAGMTGSGKSVLLHDIILATLNRYTPDEVEMYLFDFKQTPGGFEKYYLKRIPHIRTIAVRDQAREIRHLLEMIRDIYIRRLNLVREANCSGIIDYNEYAESHPDLHIKRIPRIMIIIDEYHSIDDDRNIDILDDIARKGREYGVTLIMASQKASESKFTRIISQFTHRFEFRNEPVGGLITAAAKIRGTLDSARGMCCYAHGSSGTPIVVRTAYCDKKNTDTVLSAIEKCTEGWQTDTYKVGTLKNELVRPVDYLPRERRFATVSERKNTLVRVRGEAENETAFLADAEKKFESGSDGMGYLFLLGIDPTTLAPIICSMDPARPHLVLFGSGDRLRSLEYTIIKNAYTAGLKLSGEPEHIFVFDGRARRGMNGDPLDFLAKSGLPRTQFYRKENFDSGIDDLYTLYTERRTGRAEYPVLVVISDLGRFLPDGAANVEEKKQSFADLFKSDSRKAGDSSASGSKESFARLTEMIRSGKSLGIFFVMSFTDENDYQRAASREGGVQINSRITLALLDNRPYADADFAQAVHFHNRLIGNGFAASFNDQIDPDRCCMFNGEKIQNYIDFVPYEYH